MSHEIDRVGAAATSPSRLPVLGVQSQALRSAAGRRDFSRAQPGSPQSASFASLLGWSSRAIGRAADPAFGLGSLAQAARAGVSRAEGADTPPFADLLEAVARQVGLEPALLAAVAESESGFNPRAVSRAGAKGLMQLMDSTARSLGVSDSFDPLQNLVGGARFLRGLLDRYSGSLPLALAAYNAGPGAVDRYGGIPPYAETQAYVPRVLATLERYRQSAWSRGTVPT